MKSALSLFSAILVSSSLFSQPADKIFIPAFHKTDTTILKKGKVLIPKYFIDSMNFRSGLAPATLIDTANGNYQLYTGFVNKKGKQVIPFSYNYMISHFGQGLAVMEETDRSISIIDVKNQKNFPGGILEVTEIKEGLVFIKYEPKKWKIFSVTGEEIFPYTFEAYRLEKERLLLKKDGKWAMADKNGNLLLDFKYKNITPEGNAWKLERFPVWQVKDEKGKIFSSLECDTVLSVSPELFKYRVNGSYGLCNREHLITIPLFEEIENFRNGTSIISIDGLYGLIDTMGKFILPPEFAGIEYEGDYIKVKQSCQDKQPSAGIIKESRPCYGLHSPDGRNILPAIHTEIRNAGEGMFQLKSKEGKRGIINLSGDTVIPFKFFFLSGKFKNGIIPAMIDKNTGLINANGEWIVCPEDYPLYNAGYITVEQDSGGHTVHCRMNHAAYKKFFRLPNGYVKVEDIKGKYGVTDINGREIISPQFDNITSPENAPVFIVTLNNKMAVMDKQGNFLFSFKDDVSKIFFFSDDFAAFRRKELYGFMNLEGEVRVSPQYEKASYFSEGLCAVMIKGKWGYIDKDEKIIIQPHYDEALPFERGKALVLKGGEWNFIDKENKSINNASYDEIYPYKEYGNKWVLRNNGKIGLADSLGKEIVVPRYDDLEDYFNGYIKVKRDDWTGILDYDQNFVFPIEYDEILMSENISLGENIFLLMKNREAEIYKEEIKIKKINRKGR